MHLHAEHSLFFERRQPPWVAALGIVLTSSVLMVNAGARSIELSLIGSGTGVVLLLFARARGRRRVEPALARTTAIVALALGAGAVLGSNVDTIVQASDRVLCGVIWVLWLGTLIDWASLREILLWFRVPETIVANLDHAILHGVLTQRDWVQRRDAARLRLGSPRLPMAAWGGRCSAKGLCMPSRASNALRRTHCCVAPRAKTIGPMSVFTSMPSTSSGVGSWCSSSSSFTWDRRSGCWYAGRAERGNRACCACSRGSTDSRRGP